MAATPVVPTSGAKHSSKRLLWRVLGGLLLTALIAYAGALLWIYERQEKLLFLGEPLPREQALAQDGDVHETQITVPGATLSALHLKLPHPKGVIFFLHGNKGNLTTWFVNLDLYRRANYDLFMVDYRGYGKSSGRIESEDQLHADVLAAWNAVAEQYKGKRRVIYGRSLGSGLAARLASQVQPDLTILVSPYCTMAEVGSAQYPWVPVALLRYPLRTCDDVGKIRGPLALVHGNLDTLIPFHHSEEIQARAPAAQLIRIEGAGHGDIHKTSAYQEALTRLLATLP